MEKKRLVIIGSGPAGYTAAIYAARANLEPILFEGFFSGPAGGQLMTTTEVENYPGFPDGITGPELMMKFREQAERFGCEMVVEDVKELHTKQSPFKVVSKSREILADAVIISTGATAKRLDIPGTKDGEFWQKGVSACAVCDGAAPIFREKEVYVVGGGDTAVEEALFLTKYATKVYIVHRRDQLRASKIMAERAMKHPKVEILWNKVVTKVEGEKVVTSVTIMDLVSQKEEKRNSGGLFFAIGHQPNTSFLGDEIQKTPNGYLVVQPGTSKTNIDGIFAAGDVQDPYYRQAVTAAGSGCMAALDAEKWLFHT